MSGEEHGLRVPPPQLAEKDREENMSVLLLLVNNKIKGVFLMKINVICKKTAYSNLNWYSWLERCDECGATICGYEWEHSCKPNLEEEDLCINCLKKRIAVKRNT